MKVQNLVVTEKYMKNGEEKKAYKTIGKLFTFDDGGMSIKIEMVPTGNWNGNANVYDIKDRAPQHVAPQQSQPNPAYAQQPQQYQAPQQQQQQAQPTYETQDISF